MKKLLIVALAVLATACSTTKHSDADAQIGGDAVKFTQDFGKVEVTFNDKGDWLEINSTATSAVPINDEAGLEQGMNIATMRAKRNIVEFINTDLKSTKNMEAMTNSLAKEVASNDEKAKDKAASIATQVAEKIAVQADGILRGVYVVDRKVSADSKTVSVKVQVDKRSIRAAKNIRVSMQ